MNKLVKGFTLVEILVVVAIIGILSTISLIGFDRYQAATRDSARTSKATILAEALEKYYDQKGEYPSCAMLTGSAATVTSTILPGIEQQTLVAPDAPSGTTNSFSCNDLTNAATQDYFSYTGDTSTTCVTNGACVFFQLKYKQESTGQIITINSRRLTSLAFTTPPSLATNPAGFTQINLSWTQVSGSTGYEVTRATDSLFTQNVVTTMPTNTSASITGLTYNTTYFFRVRATSPGGPGGWSNTATASTWGLSIPIMNAATDPSYPSTKFITSWQAIPNAASYNVQCSSDGSAWSGCTGSTTNLNYSWGPTLQGTPLYFRVQAVNGSFLSAWSSTVSATTTIDAPAAFPLYSSNLLPNWNWLNVASGATCPAGTSLSSDWYANGAFWTRSGTAQSYGLNWNTGVTISVTTKCVTAYAASAWTGASNTAGMSLPWPNVWTALTQYRTASWGGTCPNWTTASRFYWNVHGTGSVGYTSGGPTGETSWDGTGYSWGNGDIRATLQCDGPWGTVSVDSEPAPFGPGCLPTITVGECTW